MFNNRGFSFPFCIPKTNSDMMNLCETYKHKQAPNEQLKVGLAKVSTWHSGQFVSPLVYTFGLNDS